jgi:hypothetical protein
VVEEQVGFTVLKIQIVVLVVVDLGIIKNI